MGIYDDYDYDDPFALPRVGLRDRSSTKCKYTHKTHIQSRGRRPNVAQRSRQVAEPCPDEGVPFVQKLICDDDYY